MREIVFKAKRIDNGEWVEGGYVNKTDCYGMECDEHYIIDGTVTDMEGYGEHYLVDKDTICQYTGLTDKNGNKIWENDIVYIPYERLEDSYCKVVFRRGGFIGEMADGCEDCLLNRKAEVIGNIFDNPELIGEQNG